MNTAIGRTVRGDTLKLLRECDAGVKMGIASLNDVIPSANDYALEQSLKQSKTEHERLRAEAETQLNALADKGKAPDPIAAAMSHVKTEMVTALDGSDSAVARLISKGCDMGVRSLNGYLDKYPAADSQSRSLACRIINAEEKLARTLQKYTD